MESRPEFQGFPVSLFLEWHRESRSTWHAWSHHDLCTDQRAEAMPQRHTSFWPRGFPFGLGADVRLNVGRCQRLLPPVSWVGETLCGPSPMGFRLPFCASVLSPPGDCAHPTGSIQVGYRPGKGRGFPRRSWTNGFVWSTQPEHGCRALGLTSVRVACS